MDSLELAFSFVYLGRLEVFGFWVFGLGSRVSVLGFFGAPNSSFPSRDFLFGGGVWADFVAILEHPAILLPVP